VTPPRVVPESRLLPVAPPSSPAPGRLILRVLVGVDGRVADLEVVRAPYGGEALSSDAIAAVRAWRYAPAQRDGSAVACWTVESVEFVSGGTPPALTPPPPLRAAPAPEPPTAAPVRTAPPAGSTPQVASPPPSLPPVLENLPEPRPPSPPGVAPGPAPRGISPEPAIDLTRGGPPPLQLGGSGPEAAEFLGADPAAGSIRAPDRGLEVAIVERDGERRIASIRYLFADGRDGFRASALRTRSGLGKGSACVGIPAAQGRPTARAAAVEAGGVSVERLRYESDGAVATFVCADGRLVEMTIAAAGRSAGD
jgi:TonB family protein